MPAALDPETVRQIVGKEFDHATHGPVTTEELIEFARALGETHTEYTEPGPGLIGHPTYCVRYKGRKFYPENLPKVVNVRAGFDAGKDIELGVPVRPGDMIEVRATLHDIYEKTGRSGTMVFIVFRTTVMNQDGQMVAIVDQKMMFR